MKHQIQKRFIHFTLTFTGLLLTGCATIKDNAPQNYYFPNHSNRGILAFSVQCHTMDGDGMIDFSRDFDLNRKPTTKNIDYRVMFSCYADKLGKPEYKYISLPAGYYSLYNFKITFMGGEALSKNFEKLSFFLRPNKLNYLGRIQFTNSDKKHFQIAIWKMPQTDFPIFEKNLPNIKKKDYQTVR